MKSILVIDTPKNCRQCFLCRLEGVYVCIRTRQILNKDIDEGTTNRYCPLKPIPSNLDWRYINETTNTDSFEYGRCCGRQEIIDEILGEEQ